MMRKGIDMSRYITSLKQQAAQKPQRIVLPESDDIRILQAADRVLAEQLAIPVLLGKEGDIQELASRYQLDLEGAEVIYPKKYPGLESLAQTYADKRKATGMTLEESRRFLLNHPLYFGAALVAAGEAAGMVAGIETPAPEVLRAALQLIGTRDDIDTVSSSFIVVTDMMQFGHDRVFVVGDGDVIPDPDEYQLADIACSCVERARRTLHIASPKVALLSYSTMGSDRGAGADKVRKAVQILSDRNVDFIYDGEMEADVALVPAYAADWAPRSPVAGQADVLVFPDLNTGNICCKMLEHVAGATVLGPLLQGLAKPVMDLSRASTVDTIVDTIVICCCDA